MTAWKNKFIPPNKFSRPTTKLKAVRKIVMHYTANNGATANGHYNYFRTLKDRYASAHLFVDKIEALCIIPLDELAYHANDRTYRGVPALRPNANFLSVGIEMCLEKDGSFHPDMIKRAEDVAKELCIKFDLNPLTDIVRHYDITGKICPAPWVSNSNLFTAFKKNVNAKTKGGVSSLSPVQASNETPLLSKGATGSAVEKLQKLLVTKGFKLIVDGDFGIATDKAVREFQEKEKLEVDGYVGDATWKKLSEVSVISGKPTVSKDAIGIAVIKTKTLNIRKTPDLNSDIVGVAIQGSRFSVSEEKGNFLKIGEGKWISNTDGKYATYTKTKIMDVIKDGIVQGEDGDMKLELDKGQLESLATVFRHAVREGLLHDKTWETKAANGTLTLSEAVYLSLMLDHRRYVASATK